MKKRKTQAARAGKKRGKRSRLKLVDRITPRLEKARSLWAQGRFESAQQLFSEALRQEPTNVRAYVDAAQAYANRYEFQKTAMILHRLCSLEPANPGVHHLAGETYAWLKLPGRAIACFETAAELPGALPRSWIELAALYERSHRLDDAASLVERALSAKPGLPKGLLVRARIERRQKHLDTAQATLRSLVESVPSESELACEAWAELAALLDQQGDYDAAFAAIEQCKRRQRERDAAEWKTSEHVLNRFRRMIDSITADDFRRWQEPRSELTERRIALLAGFPRSGTTLLEQVLDAHPELISSEERDYVAKEFFPSLHRKHSHEAPIQEVLDSLSLPRLRVERQRYFQAMEWLLGEPVGRRLHLDKNPAYNPAIPIMLRLFPETRLIIALRDPRDVVISCYLRHLPLNPVSVRFLSLERTVDRYVLDMQAWLKFREMVPVPWCEVRYEDAVAELETTARRMISTLGLPWDPAVMHYRTRLPEKHVNSPSYEAVSQPVYTASIGRWANYEKHLAPILPKLDPYLREFGYD